MEFLKKDLYTILDPTESRCEKCNLNIIPNTLLYIKKVNVVNARQQDYVLCDRVLYQNGWAAGSIFARGPIKLHFS
jgi:uncharacterized protein with PIN domain